MPDLLSHINQESYRLLVENVNEYAILLIDQEGHICTWNKGAEHIKGYKAEEIIGKHFSIFYTEADIANNLPEKLLRQTIISGRVENEGWRLRKNGTPFWANVVLTALRNQSGDLVGFGKVTRDLTKRRKAEEEIRRLNRELEQQLQQTQSQFLDYQHALDESSIVAITDQKGIIKHVNDNFCIISKYSREELLGQDHRIINSGYHSAEFIRHLWRTIVNGHIWRGEIKNKAKDGSYYWVDTTIVPFLNEKGKPYQYLAIRSDITQRKLAEEELNTSKAELEMRVKERTLELTNAIKREKELSEIKSKFVAIASHEFRTPLTSILSSSSLIEYYLAPEQTEKRQKHIARIKSSVSDLTKILDDFLSLEKLETGKVEIQFEDLQLGEFIENVIDEMDGMVKKKSQVIACACEGPPVVYIDKKILRHILLNLLSNAVKYSPEHAVVHICVNTDEDQFTISVRDEGIGIPAAAQANLFSKFFRAPNTGNIQGTGLGLNIVKNYVELMDGHIHFTSIENKGTTFTVQFPKKGKQENIIDPID